jgi:putative endonuclease
MSRTMTNATMSSHVYVLGCVTRTRHLTYVGWTTDIARRMKQHNSGKGARSTRGRAWVLLHSESFASKREAMSREWHLKRDSSFRRQLAQALRGGARP